MSRATPQRVRVAGFSVSLDGFGAGVEQSLDDPLGKRGAELFTWFFGTKTFRAMTGQGGGSDGVDERFAADAMAGIGAFILGRNMFAASRGPWPDDDAWKGWWGPNPPYHTPVFVLTHYARPSIEMEGGTTFHFVTDAAEALERAKADAGSLDVKIGGGAATVREYLRAGAVDEMHLAISPVVLGRGEPLYEGIDLSALGFTVVKREASEFATHVVLRRG